MALKEGYGQTWVNFYIVFIRSYGNGVDALTKAQAGAISGPHLYLAGVYYTTVTIATIG